MLCTIARVHIYKVSSFQLFASRNEVEAEWGQRKEKRIVFVFNLPAAGFRLLSDVHIAEQRACRALRAGSLIVEGKKTWLESSEASAALLIIMSSLQVSQRAVGGGWGRGR